MKVGVCGVGRMGEALAERLIELGHEVHIWNRTAGRCDPLCGSGGLFHAKVGEVEPGCPAGQLRSGGWRLAVAHE